MIQNYFDIGEIVNTHGISGELKVLPLTDDAKRFDDLKSVLIDNKEYVVKAVRYHKEFVLITLEGINDINLAQVFKGKSIRVCRDNAIKLPQGAYFIGDLIGIKVYENDIFLGKLVDVIQTGSNDVYVVKRDEKKDLLIPALKNVIKSVDLENEVMCVNLLEGLE